MAGFYLNTNIRLCLGCEWWGFGLKDPDKRASAVFECVDPLVLLIKPCLMVMVVL